MITAFKPSSIVLQCGADSLGTDKLGVFNLSIAAHGECVRFVKNFNLPLLILGGGGYTIHNVARCWAFETAVLVGAELPNALPKGPYLCWFQPDFVLHTSLVTKLENDNSPATLRNMVANVRTKLRYLQGSPSVSMEILPPRLKEWLEAEEKRTKDQDDIREEGDDAVDKRKDRHFAANEYFSGDKDNLGEDGDGKRIIRGGARRGAGRKPRGRGRGRGGAPATGAGDEGNESDKSGGAAPLPVKRGRGRGRGRARGRGKAATPSSEGAESNPMSE